jgi:hypothetical protein
MVPLPAVPFTAKGDPTSQHDHMQASSSSEAVQLKASFSDLERTANRPSAKNRDASILTRPRKVG